MAVSFEKHPCKSKYSNFVDTPCVKVKKKEFAMKEEEEKTKKKPNWALQVHTTSCYL